jgi:molybdopterin-containing oxidoreductase family membrane subunit
VLPAIAMAEVKLLLKSSSDQAKKKLIAEKAVDSVEAEYYLKSLEKYDSISPKVAEFQKV